MWTTRSKYKSVRLSIIDAVIRSFWLLTLVLHANWSSSKAVILTSMLTILSHVRSRARLFNYSEQDDIWCDMINERRSFLSISLHIIYQSRSALIEMSSYSSFEWQWNIDFRIEMKSHQWTSAPLSRESVKIIFFSSFIPDRIAANRRRIYHQCGSRRRRRRNMEISGVSSSWSLMIMMMIRALSMNGHDRI